MNKPVLLLIFAMLLVIQLNTFPVQGQGNPITAVIDASRTGCVAPCYIFFDGFTDTTYNGGWPETGDEDELMGRKFRDLTYEWTFGDSNGACDGSTIWQYSGESKNSDSGPVTAHVFDPCPGSGNQQYTVTLTVTDGLGNSDSDQVDITVIDPNIQFSGNTRCISNDGDFTGCPVTCPGPDCVTSSDFDLALSDALSSGARQILFRRGDSFTSDQVVSIWFDGPGIIGAFGSGSKPLITSTHPDKLFNFGRLSSACGGHCEYYDWRLQDLSFSGPADDSHASLAFDMGITGTGGGPMKQLLFYHLDWTGYKWGLCYYGQIMLTQGYDEGHSDLAVVESTSRDMSNKAVYMASERGALMGNYFEGQWARSPYDDGGHVYRIQFADRAVVSHNKLLSGGVDAGTLRGCAWNNGVRSGGCNGRYTQYVLMANNEYNGCDKVKTGGKCSRITGVKYGENGEGRLRDIIFEGNHFISGAASNESLSSGTENVLVLQEYVERVTIRNNICDLTYGWNGPTGTPGGTNCFKICNRPSDPPNVHETRVYQNTCYSGSDDRDSSCAIFYCGDNHEAVNNLVYGTGSGSHDVFGSTVGLVLDSNNVPVASNPFISSSPFAPSDYQLDPGSGVSSDIIDLVGADVFVYTDFDYNTRPSNGLWDIGAFEVQAAQTCSVPGDCNPIVCRTASCSGGECVYTNNDTLICGDALFCNGDESCLGGICITTGDPCPGQICDETNDQCIDCLGDSDCDDGNACTTDTCTGTCVNSPITGCIDDDGCCPSGCEGLDNDCVDCLTSTLNNSWQNTPITSQTGTFTAVFDATPGGPSIDGVTGLSQIEAGYYDDSPVTLRFNVTGFIDAWDNYADSPFSQDPGWYSSETIIPYSAGTEYHFRLVIDVTNQTYDAYVTPDQGSELTIATDREFRDDSGSISQLNYWHLQSGQGTHDVCNFRISSGADSDGDGCIDEEEIVTYINRWYASSQDVSMVELVRALEKWKAGSC
jgi:hypothetical protein